MKKIPLLYTDVKGTGPTVVLLHGFLASSRYWEKVTDLVSQNYKVITCKNVLIIKCGLQYILYLSIEPTIKILNLGNPLNLFFKTDEAT